MATTTMTSDATASLPGSGTNLPANVLLAATVCGLSATGLSLWCLWLQLKNYRKPTLQRFVVRILVMVPIYSIASLISLYSLDLAAFVDAVRDCYEAFVIYCFFTLLVEYLGGERSLIILLHGRPPISHPWPISVFFAPMDVSDPFTFLGLKRGILQYVQIKPVLAGVTILLKALAVYKDGSLEKGSGYTYISVVYNLSVSLCLYCLACFWIATHDDLEPYRPMPKFLCVKGIIFFTFWQGFGISILVSAGILKSDRFPTELLSLAIEDTLICFEMPLFAFMHLYAFSHTDYIDSNHVYSGRLPFLYALRDAFGYKDVFADSVTTVKGSGFSYRTFEPAEGGLHQGRGRDRRVRAGLRYAEGGKKKYWIPVPGDESDAHGRHGKEGLLARPFHTVKRVLEERLDYREGYAPLEAEEAAEVVHPDPRKRAGPDEYEEWLESGGAPREYDSDSDAESLGFGAPEEEDEGLYKDARRLEFGDYNYPVVDASREEARRRLRDEEEGKVFTKPLKKAKGKGIAGRPAPQKRSSYGNYAEPPSRPHSPSDPATSADHPGPEGGGVVDGAKRVLHTLTGNDDEAEEAEAEKRREEERTRLPPDAVDLVVEDRVAEEEEMVRDRRKGEPGKKKRVFRQIYDAPSGETPAPKAAPSPSAGSELSPVISPESAGSAPKQHVEVHDTSQQDGHEVNTIFAQEEEPTAKTVGLPTPLASGHDDNPWGG